MEVSELTTNWIHKERLDAMNKRVIGSQRYLTALQLIEDLLLQLQNKNAVSEKVQQMPGQPMIGFIDYRIEKVGEPAFRKSIDARGNEIALQFEADA